MISGKYRVARRDNESESPKVKIKPKPTRVRIAKNFAKTIWNSDTGKVNKTSMVLALFSSEKIRIERAGTKTINNHGKKLKNGRRDADPTTKMSLTKIKLAKTANNKTTI